MPGCSANTRSFYLVSLVLVTAFLGAVIAVPLTREALGQRDEPVAAHFVVGLREARMFFALVRFYAILILALVAFAFAAEIAVTTAARMQRRNTFILTGRAFDSPIWLKLAAGLLAASLFLIVASRLGFMLTPMAAAEKHVSLARAGGMSRGNFWRIAFIYLVVGFPATLLLITCETSFGGLQMGKTLPSGMQAFYTVAPDDIATFATGLLAVGLVVLQALFAGASAAAYEELVEATVYDTAHEAAPASVFHEPAMAFADAAPWTSATRPTDHRAEFREDLASEAAAESAVIEPQHVESAAPSVEHDLPDQAAVAAEAFLSIPKSM